MALASWRRVGLLKSDESYKNAMNVDRAFSNAEPRIANRQSAASVNLSVDRMRNRADGFHACANSCVRVGAQHDDVHLLISRTRLQS